MGMLIPTVIEKRKKGDVAYDIFSRLLEDRIVFVGTDITFDVANSVIAQLLYLDKKNSKEDVKIYINSTGGFIVAGMAIIDTMNHIKCDVSTIAVGLAASMAASILVSGAKGKRFCLPNAEILLHQPLGGVEGQATEIEIAARHIVNQRDKMFEMIASRTGKTKSRVEKDADRNNWMTAKEALDYGLIDKIIK